MFTQQPDQKNLMLAIILSMGVLLAWQYFYAGPKLREEQERQKMAAQPTAGATPGAQSSGVPTTGAAIPGQQPGAGATAQVIKREDAIRLSPRVGIQTPALKGSISLVGARFDDIELVKYRETIEPNSPNVTLFSPSGTESPYYSEQGWVTAPGTAQKMPDRDTVWAAETKGPLTPTSPVLLSWDNGQGLLFRRSIMVDQSYMFTVRDEIENKSAGDVTLYPYSLISRHGTPKTAGIYILHEGLIGVLGSTGLVEVTYPELTKEIDTNLKKSASNASAVKDYKSMQSGWLGITDKYWAAVLVPNQSIEYDARLWARKENGREYFQADFRQPAVTIAPGAKGTGETQLFAGAKDVFAIDTYKAQYNIKQFDSMIDWGTFWYITKPLFYLIDWINRRVGNFGITILLITVLVKALFFPLANRSYESMAKMKKLQPEMEKIRERFKDDKAKQQQELMALYAKEKINPVMGCLPILVQIPVFFALYKVLFVTLDMRQAPFFGWIKDLSMPDPTSLTNLFGLLPWPALDQMFLGYTIGAWALVMGLTMWLQMQLNPQQPDPVQQQMFNWMPVMFTFMLGGFASGLVIYWAWSNILSIAQQWLIMKKNGVEVPLVDNLRKNLKPLADLISRYSHRKE
jgi:YidC/Oxa1 family membrane protein insertase